MYLLSFCYQIPWGFFLQLVCVIFEVKNCFRSVKKMLLSFFVAMVISCTSDNSGVLGELVVEDNLGSDVIEIGEGSENEQTETSETAEGAEEQSGGESEGEGSNSQEGAQTPGLYMEENGVTLVANSAAKPGDELVFGGITYLVVDNQMLRDIVTDDREDISLLVTTYVTDLSNIFENKQTITPNIAAWDTSNVTDMSYLFSGASVYNGVLSYWNTAKVTNMSYAFANALEYNQDLGDWNTSQVTQMDAMFSNATAFNQNLSGWCVSLIDKAPTNFSTGSLISQTSLPLWGTCPD